MDPLRKWLRRRRQRNLSREEPRVSVDEDDPFSVEFLRKNNPLLYASLMQYGEDYVKRFLQKCKEDSFKPEKSPEETMREFKNLIRDLEKQRLEHSNPPT